LFHYRDYTRPELPSGDNESGASSAHTSVPDITAALAGEFYIFVHVYVQVVEE
jgi:hypothetical protein